MSKTIREMKQKIWMLYDSRFRFNEDDAMLFEICESRRKAEENASDYGSDTVIVEADLDGKEIVNSRIIN